MTTAQCALALGSLIGSGLAAPAQNVTITPYGTFSEADRSFPPVDIKVQGAFYQNAKVACKSLRPWWMEVEVLKRMQSDGTSSMILDSTTRALASFCLPAQRTPATIRPTQ